MQAENAREPKWHQADAVTLENSAADIGESIANRSAALRAKVNRKNKASKDCVVEL